MDICEAKKILCYVEKVSFTKHFQAKSAIRGIDHKDISALLASHDRLIDAEDQGEDDKGHKYALLFSKSNKYDLRVIVSIKGGNLNVITAHFQNIKRRKAYEKWLGKRR